MTGEAAMVRWVTEFVRLLVEVERGQRPVRHLRPFLDPEVHLVIRPALATSPPVRIGRVLVQCTATRCHAVAVLHTPARVTALTLMVRRDGHRRVISDIGRPEHDAVTPEPPPVDTIEPLLAVGHAACATIPPAPRYASFTLPDGWRRRRREPAVA